jgi:hypothetical protein
MGKKGNTLIKVALDSIIGIDVHPVAALMAKANVLLALASELPSYKDDIYLRVYLADTLMTGEDTKRKALVVNAGERSQFYIPLDTLEKGRDLDSLIDKMSEFAKRGTASRDAEKRAAQGFAKLLEGYTSHEVFLWRENFRVMVAAVGQKRDTIWGFVLKNAYRPAYLRRQKVDVIVANPPWLSLRDIKDHAYKVRIKELTFKYKLLGKKERKLFTQIDTSTVFYAHSLHEFLQRDGTMAFVMPKSVILPAKQHLAFQKDGFTAIHEFSHVKGLFKVPTCVLIHGSRSLIRDIPITHWRGDLTQSQRNLRWGQAQILVKPDVQTWSFPLETAARSPYFPLFLNGATIYPRSLWFAESPPNQPVNPKSPFLHTAKSIKADAKKPWKKLEVKGRVEKDFLFGTVLADDLLPFAVRKLRLVVLPLLEKQGRLVMLKHEEILAEGAPLASDWVRTAERIWERRKKEDQPTLYEYLNYDQKLTNQNPSAEFIVLYNKSGTNIAAAYLTPSEHKRVGDLPIRGFVVDHVAYRYYADSEEHALYLVGILNTAVVNEAIKRYQPQGLKGERDIHRRPFEVCPIPLFDAKDDLHRRIVKVGIEARRKMLEWKSRIEGDAARARRAARKVIQPELDSLDELVRALLKKNEFREETPEKSSRLIRDLFPSLAESP